MKEKKLLIIERCDTNLECNKDNDSIVLTGLFTSFNTKNRNGRVYESADFLPHVEALRERISSKSLLGEMDHPHGFEISLSNVSHVIESLEYDSNQNAIVGKVRLLNTARGKDAQALVRDGIPLHISSRAAGTVDESGKVRLNQLFTYDLVADPGFANAVLSRVNEGVENDSISNESKEILKKMNEEYKSLNESYTKIGEYENTEVYVMEDSNTDLNPGPVSSEGGKAVDFGGEQSTKNSQIADTQMAQQVTNNVKTTTAVPVGVPIGNAEPSMEGQYISYADFQKYSEHLAEIISELQSAIANYKSELATYKTNDGSAPTENYKDGSIDNSMIADMVAKEVAAQTAKNVPAEVPAENNQELQVKAEEMEEKYNNLTKYVKYLAETLDKSITHQDYITDEANKIISHNNYLAEKMNQMIDHQDYMVENMNNMIDHQDYLAENINDTIKYQEYVAEMLDKSIDYSNMLAEEQNKTIKYNEYLAEKMNQMIDHQDYIAECVNNIDVKETIVENNVNETKENTEENKVEESVVEQKPKFDSKAYQKELNDKLSALISSVKEQYEETKRLEAEALAESKKNVQTQDFNLINYMPARLQEKWSKLSDNRKQEILSESKMFVVSNASSAEYFWNTRDMREKQIDVQKVEENVVANNQPRLTENVMDNDRYKMMSEIIKNRMRRY